MVLMMRTIQAFFIHYQTLISYPWPEQDDNSEWSAWPTFKTLGDWKKKPTTKLQTVINIIVDLLGHDNANHLTQDVHGCSNEFSLFVPCLTLSSLSL
jgi:hypothetical protein